MAQPVDDATSYEAGVEARLSGEFEKAADIFERQTRRQPDNADAWVQLGLSLLPLEEYRQADKAFETALRLAPDYTDARIGLARSAWYRGDLDTARQELALAGDRPDANRLREQIAAAENARQQDLWRLDIAAGRSALTQDLPDWEEYTVAAGRKLSPRTSITGLAEYTVRFERDDIYLQTRMDQRFGQFTYAYLALGGTPQADFRPELALLGGVSTPLPLEGSDTPSLFITLDGTLASYGSGDVASTAIGLRRSFLDNRLQFSARAILLSDESNEQRQGYSVGGEVQASPKVRLVATYTDAPETSEGVTIDVTSTSLVVHYDISDTSAIRFTATHEERQAYERAGLVVGLTRRF